MKIFANKNIWRKIVIILIAITLISFAVPTVVVQADDEDHPLGGQLMEPVLNLLVGIGDGAISILHKIILGQEQSRFTYDLHTSGWVLFAKIAVGLLAIAIAVAIAAPGTFILAALNLASLATVGTMIAVGIGTGVYTAVQVYDLKDMDDELVLPMYNISPEEIFKGSIPLFDVNFFNPDTSSITYDYGEVSEWEGNSNDSSEITKALNEYFGISGDVHDFIATFTEPTRKDADGISASEYYEKQVTLTDGTQCTITVKSTGISGQGTIFYTLTSSVPVDGGSKTIGTYSYQLQAVVRSWYTNLRLLAIVGMMSVLVFIGIKILLASTASQKAKYKQLLFDWFVGMVLLFVMHYIMVFANEFVDKLTDMLATVNQGFYTHRVNLNAEEEKVNKGIIQGIEADTAYTVTNNPDLAAENPDEYIYADYASDDDKTTASYLVWRTNLMGYLRMEVNNHKDNSESYIGYVILYLILVIYTLIFCFTYIKRVVIMAFLTMIAPLVALTYPIDKANDGKAQGFDMWFKEYIFNLLLQPMHLLIYSILVSSAIVLAMENPIYAIVAIGFMVPAEKLIRQMFNFSKASTPGAFGGAAGAALTMSGIRWLTGHGPKGGKGKGEKDDEGKDANGKPVTSSGRNTLNPASIFGGSSNGSNGDDSKVKAKGDEKSTEQKENKAYDQETSQRLYDEGLNSLFGDNDSNDSKVETKGDEKSEKQKENMKAYDQETSQRLYNEGIDSLFDDDDKSKTKPSMKRALKNGFGMYKDGMKHKLKRSLKSGQPIRKLGRLGAGALGAAALGTVGIAAGAATGDASKALQYASAGALGGYKLNANTFDVASRVLNVNGVGEQMRRSYLGADAYRAEQARKTQKEASENEKNIQTVAEKFGIDDRSEAKEKLAEMINYYYEKNITTDLSDMITIEKTAKNTGKSRDEIAGAYWYDKRYNIDANSEKKDAIIKAIIEDSERAGNKLTRGQAENIWDSVVDYRNNKWKP